VRSIAVAPDGSSFAIGGRGGLVSLYDAVTFRPVVDLTGPKIDVNCVRFSPNGKRLAVASGDWMAGQQGLVTVWNLDTQTASTTLDFDSVPAAVAFASEDDLIVGQFDGEAVWINLQSRTVVSRADGQKEAIHAAAFSPDNPALQNIRFQRGADPLATQSAEPVPSFDWSGLLRLDGPSEASR
jgi:WD40 repeat protein